MDAQISVRIELAEQRHQGFTVEIVGAVDEQPHIFTFCLEPLDPPQVDADRFAAPLYPQDVRRGAVHAATQGRKLLAHLAQPHGSFRMLDRPRHTGNRGLQPPKADGLGQEVDHAGIERQRCVAFVRCHQHNVRQSFGLTRELLDGNDDLVLTIITSGNTRASQRGRDIELGPGQAVLQSSAEAGNMVVPVSPSRFVGLRLPRKAVALLVRDPEEMLIRPLPANTEAMRLLALYIRELDDSYQLATAELRGAVVRHLVDLGALIIGANRDAVAAAEDGGVAAARLAAVKADINDNLSYGDLTLPAVAARLRLTPRHIQRLFESVGSTFSEFVLGQRLARAHHLLTDPRHSGSTIGTIAFEVGFGDLSYFNRTFRRHYGATPSDIRAVPRRS